MSDELANVELSPSWSGDSLLAMFTAGAQVLESHVNLVNRLNVFPVQDGDTGINMLLTLRDTLAEARSAKETLPMRSQKRCGTVRAWGRRAMAVP